MGWLLQILAKLALPGIGKGFINLIAGSRIRLIITTISIIAALAVGGAAYYKISKWRKAEQDVAVLRKEVSRLEAELKARIAAQKANERMLRAQIERSRRINRELSGALGELANDGGQSGAATSSRSD